jgi:hypothetical protein
MTKPYARIFQKGEIDFIGMRVTSTVTFTGSNPTFELRSCPDWIEEIAETAAELLPTDPAPNVLTCDVRYNLDTSALDPGEYIAIFGVEIDSFRRRLKKLPILIQEDVC